MRNTKHLPLFLLTQRTADALTTKVPLRRIEVDLRPKLTHRIIAYERDNLDEDELLERALGVPNVAAASASNVRESHETFHDTLGLHAWPSGFVAAERMLDMLPDKQKRDDYTVLELGCGTGIPSLAAHASGVGVIATDLDVDIISRSLGEQQQLLKCKNEYQCRKLDLLNKSACEELIQKTKPNLIIAADCLYDVKLAKAVGQTMGMAADRYGCTILVADPGRLDGRGRELFLDGFFDELSTANDAWREIKGFEEVDMPQEALKASGASLSWCGVFEKRVGIFTWFNLAIDE
jgi:predicted nicotinamide N-methyase